MRCLVEGCPGRMAGQMVVCTQHWQYLSEDLRHDAILVHNELGDQLRIGNPRREADYLALLQDGRKAVVARIAGELAEAHTTLERELGASVAAPGMAWRRASDAIAARAAAEGER